MAGSLAEVGLFCLWLVALGFDMAGKLPKQEFIAKRVD
jgi:hypothetical protein